MSETDLGLPEPNATQRPAVGPRSGCALAHLCAAERRLMVTGVNRFPGIHTSFPCSLKWGEAI